MHTPAPAGTIRLRTSFQDQWRAITERTSKLGLAVETYFDDLRRIRASGGGTHERSYYPPLTNLLNAVGAALRPKVFCGSELAHQGAGHPDLGLYAAKQVQRGQPREGQTPEGGVVEVKSAGDDAWLTADSTQVSRYWEVYRRVLVTNTRDFVLLGENSQGNPAKLEIFRLAQSASDFETKLQHPRAFANRVGPALAEYLGRALSHRATLAEPRDLARLLASYARDGLARVEASGDASSLDAVRTALEEALGVKFEGERGAAFFRSTLVQTLFYGVFSAWVLWSRQASAPTERFDWRTAVWHLRAPVLRALFQQLSDPGRLQPLGLIEVLDWTAAALDRVDRAAFFARFNEGGALLLRAVPGGLRPCPAQAVGRLVHPRRGGALHGGPSRPRPQGRPRHRRWSGRGQRLRVGPVLWHWRVPSRDPEAHSRQPGGRRRGGADGREGEAGRHPAGIWVRDHACPIRRGPPAAGPLPRDPSGPNARPT